MSMRMARRYLARVAMVLGFMILAASPPATQASPATPVSDAGWRVVEQRAIETRGEVVTLSPDGQWVAGTRLGPDFQQELCLWSVATLAETACVPVTHTIDPDSIRWAPDSTAITFTEDGLPSLVDLDIHVFELETGEVVNLTDDGVDGEIPIDDVGPGPEPVPVDYLPTWSADSQSLTFARSSWLTGDSSTALWTVARSGGEPEPRHVVRDDLPFAIPYPMTAMADGSLLYTVWSLDTSDAGSGLWRLGADGKAELLLPGTGDSPFPAPVVVDVAVTAHGLRASGYSAIRVTDEGVFNEPVPFLLDLDTGIATPVSAANEAARAILPLRFSPDGQAMTGLEIRDGGTHLVVRTDTGIADLGPVRGQESTLRRGPDWVANNTILVGTSLLTIAPTG